MMGSNVHRAASAPLGIFLAFVLTIAGAAPSSPQNTDFVWIEAETPARANFEFNDEATGRPNLLSAGKWLRKSLSKQQAKEQIPDEGLLLDYNLRVPAAGEYELWARVGYEWARAPLEWRIADNDWQRVPTDVQTTNVMQLGEWMEVAWLKLGDVQLPEGNSPLHLRYSEPGPDGRALIGLDCIAAIAGRFTPHGRLKPNETYESDLKAEAAAKVFQFPAPQPARRTKLTLNGPWEIARYDDEDMDDRPHEPPSTLPAAADYPLRWMGITVPGSLWNKDETRLAHRVIYRTRVRVPAEYDGSGFHLHFSGTNWLAGVFVNGELAGTHRGVWIPWDLDISDHLRPGAINELAVAIKSPYYAIDVKHYGKTNDLDRHRNLPKSRMGNWVYYIAPICPSTKGDGDGKDYGIVNPVTLVSTGNAYTSDVFVKPSVAQKRLDADVTVRNTTDTERSLTVLCEAVNDATGVVEKQFGPVEVSVGANAEKTIDVAGDWADPKLWWPEPNPNLYQFRTTVSEGGKPLDVHNQLFGFREVTIEGTGICINGVRRNFWNWVGVAGRPASPGEWLEQFRAENDRFTRFSANRKISRFLRTREERLEFYDRHGVPGRLCSMIDGMFITRVLGERKKDPDTGERVFVPNEPVWDGFRRHLVQLAKAYRNHPSVIFYQAENELVYITGMNLYGGYVDFIEPLMADCIEAARQFDPTRPYTVGGAGDLGGRLEINCPHYPAGSLDYYPENAYTVDKYTKKISRWPWKREKPWVVGESAYADEINRGSYVLGDEVFRGPHAAHRGKAKYVRMLYSGYRWANVAGFFPWTNLQEYEDGRKIFSDLYIAPRKQASRLIGGQSNELQFKVLNDTFSHEPVSFRWRYELDGAIIASGETSLDIEPGFGQEQTLTIEPPDVQQRTDGELIVSVVGAGDHRYADERAIPVLPAVDSVDIDSDALVLDPSGGVQRFLGRAGVGYQPVEGLAELSQGDGLAIVGPDALTEEQAQATAIKDFAMAGGRVIVLEQDNPLAADALPIPVETTEHYGGYAHPTALGTPLFEDLGAEALIDWAGDHPVYKRAYVKPTGGGRTLAECGGGLELAALVEVPCGTGVIALCQLRVGDKLGIEPAADVLMRNMMQVYSDYAPATGVVAVFAPDRPALHQQVEATGVITEAENDLAAALEPQKYRVVVIDAGKANLARLNELADKLDRFQSAGGWIMLNGLEPDGMEAFNDIVPPAHMLRPFRLERVTLENAGYELAARLGNRDLAMYSDEVMIAWQNKNWLSQDEYTYVVDGKDIAPFCRMPGGPADPFEYQPKYNDKDPYNFVNGMFNSDFWKCIRQIWLPEEGAEPLTFTLRHPDVVSTIKVWNNANYWTIENVDIIFDGNADEAVRMTLPDSYGSAMVELDPPRHVNDSITLQIVSWRKPPNADPDRRLVGIDNVQFLRPAPPEGAIILDNVGGLVAYPAGDRSGGVFLNQLKFPENDGDQVGNLDKKRRILGVILQNMGAGLD